MPPASDCLVLHRVAALSKPSSCDACEDLCATPLVYLLVMRKLDMWMQAQVFGPFAAINALQVSEYMAPAWASARASYEAQVAPLEQRMSQQIKAAFGAVLLPALAAAVAEYGSPDSAASAAQPQQVSAARNASWSALIQVTGDLVRERQCSAQMLLETHRERHCRAVA